MTYSKTMVQRLVAGAAAILIAILIAITLIPTSPVQGLTVNPDFIDHEVSIGDYSDTGPQTVKVEFFYGEGDTVAISTEPTATITINGSKVDLSRIEFDDGDSFVIYIAPTDGYSTVISGRITVDIPDMSGVQISDGTDTTDASPITSDNFPETVIPLGATIDTANEHSSDDYSATADILSVPNGNGMIHIGLYYKNAYFALQPIWNDPTTNTDPIQIYTYAVFIDTYDPSNPLSKQKLADSIANTINADSQFSKTGYTLTSAGTSSPDTGSITLSGPNPDEVLYVLIFDDNLVKDLETTYPDVVQAEGVLDGYPY